MQLTAQQLACATGSTLPNALRVVNPLVAAMNHFDINTPKRVAMFLAQLAHETGHLTRFEENLSYSAERLTKVWPKRFPTLASTQGYARNPEALAEKVYGGRMGNTAPGDGWLYRGRGGFQLTGKSMYQAAEDGLGMSLTGPDAKRVADAEAAMWTACWYWYSKGCNDLADADDFEQTTQVINGGQIGAEERQELYEHAAANLPDEIFA